MRKQSNRIRAEKGSGNVFADLDLPHAEQDLLKARLTLQIYKLIKDRGLTQAKVDESLGIKQPHVSALMRTVGGLSAELLREFLTALGTVRRDHRAPDTKGLGKVSCRRREVHFQATIVELADFWLGCQSRSAM